MQNSTSQEESVVPSRRMALAPATHSDGPLFAEVDMGGDSSAPTVRATVVQASTIFYDTPATLDKAERLLAEAASFGSQLVVFPEAFVGGYPRGSNFGVTIGNRMAKGKEEFRKYHASAIDVPGPEVDRLAAMAGKYKVYLVMGVIERDGYTLYCTILFFDSQGHFLGKHRKVMPTALERIIWGFGDGSTVPVFDTAIGKIGAAICWENKMPLLRMAMYGKGIEIYCAPTADARDIWQASMTHIALEGGCFVLSANQFCQRKDYPPPPDYVFHGTEEDLTPDSVVCAGGSVIISPSGTVLAGPNFEGEALISADLDLGEIARAKFDFEIVDIGPTVKATAVSQMEAAVDALSRDLSKLRSGRASAGMLDHIIVETGGVKMSLNHLAVISVVDSKTLSVTPYDPNTLKELESAIVSSPLGLNPKADGQRLIAAIPPLTKEHMQALCKVVAKSSEDVKQSIRRARQKALDSTKKAGSSFPKDEAKRLEKEVDELTKKFIKLADDMCKAKEKEITAG